MLAGMQASAALIAKPAKMMGKKASPENVTAAR
jgi:hypothetical protein